MYLRLTRKNFCGLSFFSNSKSDTCFSYCPPFAVIILVLSLSLLKQLISSEHNEMGLSLLLAQDMSRNQLNFWTVKENN